MRCAGGEIRGANIGDFDPLARTLNIYGKGRGTQAQLIDLHSATADAISDWLSVRGAAMPLDPLFIALTKREYGLRLSGYAIYKLVFSTCTVLREFLKESARTEYATLQLRRC
jgi:integrase/recombinase XerC